MFGFDPYRPRGKKLYDQTGSASFGGDGRTKLEGEGGGGLPLLGGGIGDVPLGRLDDAPVPGNALGKFKKPRLFRRRY